MKSFLFAAFCLACATVRSSASPFDEKIILADREKNPARKAALIHQAISSWEPSDGRESLVAVNIWGGEEFLKLRLPLEALGLLDNALKLDASKARGYKLRALAHQLLYQYQAAIDDFNLCLGLEPSNDAAEASFCNLYTAILRPTEALGHCKRALEFAKKPRQGYYIILGAAQIELRNLAEARSSLERAQFLTGHETFHGFTEEDRAREISDFSPLIQPYLARIDFLEGRIQKAESELDQAIQAMPGNPDALLFRGDLYKAQHQYAKAIADYSKALELVPGLPILLYARGGAYESAGKPVEAKNDLSVSCSAGINDACAALQAVPRAER